MTRNQKHDDDASYSKTCDKGGGTHWSDPNHDVLFSVMMKLGVIDFFPFSGVCKSWKSVALSNRKMFMVSKPPMSLSYSTQESCCLEDFEGRKLKINFPDIAHIIYPGLTCGYLVFVIWKTKDFWLVNPITRHELHFPAFPKELYLHKFKAIRLVFSPSINGWVFVVSNMKTYDLWFSISGKGSWNQVPSSLQVLDIHAFKGKIYTLNTGYQVCELRLNPEPRLILLEIKNFPERCVSIPVFVSSGENLYAMDQNSLDLSKFQELDFGKMKWVSPEKKTIGDYVFFRSTWNNGVAIKSESWAWAAEPPSIYKRVLSECLLDTTRKGGLFVASMSYFPHQCLDVDLIS